MEETENKPCSGLPWGAIIYAAIILAAIETVLLIRAFVIEPFSIPTESMCDTIEVGDSVLAEKITLELGGNVSQGDIIVFENPERDPEKDVLCKRVIARGGQTVDLKDGSVYIDGKKIAEDYAKGDSYPLYIGKAKRISYPYKVPEGEIWVMGDNRENSADSRYFGAISEDSVIGICVMRHLPVNRIDLL
ncbi:signal peptidase I [Collinsella sp. AF38-3AC]|uniref:signal peptidase I n=1 Tax=Collinsella sp. AF38-3AC TaxID=2292015 RepID=UPI001314C4DE|nr:signal peptidase I [Collinsella sp. AF38-3AC]